MTHPHILMILTSHDKLGDTGEATGLWLEELTTPYYTFIDADAKVTLASILGGKVPVDPRSNQDESESVHRFLADTDVQTQLNHTPSIQTINMTDFDAIFLPGGHGTMWDLPNSDVLAEGLSDAWQAKKVIAAVCHGPAGLVHVRDENNTALVKGRRVTGFTNDEEVAVKLDQQVPFLLESRLRKLGAHFEKIANFIPFAIEDGRLITGQNPASAALTADLTLKVLGSTK